jgi:hypothetical protein
MVILYSGVWWLVIWELYIGIPRPWMCLIPTHPWFKYTNIESTYTPNLAYTPHLKPHAPLMRHTPPILNLNKFHSCRSRCRKRPLHILTILMSSIALSSIAFWKEFPRPSVPVFLLPAKLLMCRYLTSLSCCLFLVDKVFEIPSSSRCCFSFICFHRVPVFVEGANR